MEAKKKASLNETLAKPQQSNRQGERVRSRRPPHPPLLLRSGAIGSTVSLRVEGIRKALRIKARKASRGGWRGKCGGEGARRSQSLGSKAREQ